MLSPVLRIALILAATIFIIMVIRNVKRRRLLLKYSLSWLLIAPGMIVMAVFPQLAALLARLVRIETTSNFIYVVGLFLLLFMSFRITLRLSKQSFELREVLQQEAIDRYLLEHLINN